MTATEELEIPGSWFHLSHLKIVETSGEIYSDQTNRFPVPSSRGFKYIMDLHNWNNNAILAETLESRAESELLWALTALINHITYCGIKPCLHILDNKLSAWMKTLICSTGDQNQLVSLGLHLTTISERAIQTFKHQFIAGLSICNRKSPLHLWCHLIRQLVLTPNLLFLENVNPCLSAEAFLYGAFDFNKTPLAPSRTKVLIFEGPGDQKNFYHHGVEGW